MSDFTFSRPACGQHIRCDESDNGATIKCPHCATDIVDFSRPFNLWPVQAPQSVRLDKWLWAVRLYKSRSLATEACNASHVKIGGQSVKPSRDVHVAEEITVFTGTILRTVKVLALLEQRVSARLVSQFLEDLTPPEEY